MLNYKIQQNKLLNQHNCWLHRASWHFGQAILSNNIRNKSHELSEQIPSIGGDDTFKDGMLIFSITSKDEVCCKIFHFLTVI